MEYCINIMSLKIINITIPINDEIPDIISSFSPEENYLMLKIGSDCLREGRKVMSGLSQIEIYNKIKMESIDQIAKMELDIIVEKESSKKMEERISKIYEEQLKNYEEQNMNIINKEVTKTRDKYELLLNEKDKNTDRIIENTKKIYEAQLEQLKKQMEHTRDQLKIYESQNTDTINKEVLKTRDKYDLLLNEKDKQVSRLSENYEKLLIQSQVNKSTSHKGADGEKQFSDYASTFIDFKGFEIVDKHTQGGEGDFHLHFDEFDVLADAKNYKKKVPIDQREKIKKDLIKNEHLHFAWLVSLNTTIDKFDKSPIMYEWINTTQCIVYINNLSSFEDPKKILRIVWFTCKELYKLIEDVNYDEIELTELREQNFRLMDKIKNIRKTIREINTSMNTTRNLIQVMDDELKGILETETNEIVNSNFSVFDNWWVENIVITNNNSVLLSTDLWLKFKQDNKSMIKELDISTDNFKQYIKSKVSLSNIILKSKHRNCAFEIKGISFTQEAIKNTSNENFILDVELK